MFEAVSKKKLLNVQFYGVAYTKGSYGPFFKTIGLLKDLDGPEKLEEFKQLIKEEEWKQKKQ